MITKEKVKEEIDRLTQVEVEKVYLYLSSLPKTPKGKKRISTYKLKGKLDKKDLRSIAYE